MAESSVVTVRLDPKVKERLDVLAKSTRRTRSFLAAEAITAYVELNSWQIAEIEQAVEEANAGDFMSDQELAEAQKRWTS